MKRLTNPQEVVATRRSILAARDPDMAVVNICCGPGCLASGSENVARAFKQEVERQGLQRKVRIRATGCHGFCERGPLVVIHPQLILYQKAGPADASQVVSDTLGRSRLVERLLYQDPVTGKRVIKEDDVPFYKQQQRILFANNSKIDPKDISDYISVGGYAALAKVLSGMTPEEVIETIRSSGLRGRGGAGFPTARKWELCRQAPGDVKYIICNADEGDPGAFMDRSILEGNPHSVIEGIVIGAYAIGAHEGYFYIRNEYPLAVETVRLALEQAKASGLVGENILGTGFDLSLHIVRGAGAFVCGEETALMASIEGRIGEPRPRPPYPAEAGLWGKPTNINNVKTWASIPVIISRGADWFSSIGTENSKGTMVFSLVGKINNTGLVEVPMGITLREMIFGIGGGIPNYKRFKAVQTGGPSGGCIPARLMGLQVDYDQLANAGSMMGSGGMVVMDEDTCMVDVARYFLNFTKEESCGKCTPCREGTARMLEILNRITQGKGTEEDLTLLEVLARVVKETSLCGLGQTAPNPVLSTLNYFRDEYEAHVNYKRCPASVCKEIIFCSCKYSCPLGTDVPAFVALTGHRRYREAYQVIKSVNPLPLTTAYVCHHPCEERCRARDAGESISVKAIKRFACDHMLKEGMKPPRAPKKKRPEQVGIVGSGPAGLACARELATLGYRVTVFEALPVLGGMLAVGVPRFRLPREILEFDIANIARLGVEFKPGVVVGRTFTLKNLFQQGYRSILLALGAHKSLGLGIPRDDAPGVVDPLALLKAVALGKRATVGQRVAVVGGGNAAIDAARTACRLGAREVTIIYRRTRAEMPAIRREVEAALEEGVKIRFLAAPVRVLTKNGRMAGVQCISMMLGELDSGGRPRPVPIPGSEFVLEADTLIPAIGQEPDLASLGERLGLEVSRRNTIVVDPETMAAGRPGIFAAGDVVTGPSTIADSAAGGKAAALSIHRYLQGESLERVYKVAKPSMQVEPLTISEEELEEIERVSIPCTPSVMRRGNFHLVELGLSEEKAVKEAKRCLRCDLERRAA